jgi:hypothetical protein
MLQKSKLKIILKLPGKWNCWEDFPSAKGVWAALPNRAGLEGVELLHDEVLEEESGPGYGAMLTVAGNCWLLTLASCWAFFRSLLPLEVLLSKDPEPWWWLGEGATPRPDRLGLWLMGSNTANKSKVN